MKHLKKFGTPKQGVKIQVGKNFINFDKVEWFKMYDINDPRVVGKAGNSYFACYDGFDVQMAEIIGQHYINKFKFTPTSNDVPLVKIDYKKSKTLHDTNSKTGIFE